MNTKNWMESPIFIQVILDFFLRGRGGRKDGGKKYVTYDTEKTNTQKPSVLNINVG